MALDFPELGELEDRSIEIQVAYYSIQKHVRDMCGTIIIHLHGTVPVSFLNEHFAWLSIQIIDTPIPTSHHKRQVDFQVLIRGNKREDNKIQIYIP